MSALRFAGLFPFSIYTCGIQIFATAISQTILPSLTAEQVAQLSVPELIERVDSVRVRAEIERHGEAWFTQHQASFPYPRVTDLVSTLVFTSSEEQKRRRLADAAFRFLLQIDFLTVSGGF